MNKMTQGITETLDNEARTYVVSGDYVIEGDVKFAERQYDAQSDREAAEKAREDGLIRLISSLEKK